MLSLSKQSDYALLALTALARRQRQSSSLALPAKEIAEQYGIPMEFLAKVMQKLARGHFVTSTFGPTGGYKLARPAREVTVGQIIAVIDGGVALTACMRIDEESGSTVSDGSDCVHTGSCTIRGPLTRINDEIVRVLNTLTLDEIAEERPLMPGEQLVQISMDGGRPQREPSIRAMSVAPGERLKPALPVG